MLLQSGCLIKINHTPGAKRLLFALLPVRAASWPGYFVGIGLRRSHG